MYLKQIKGSNTLTHILITEAVGALWALSFDEDNRKNMVNYECLELISVLDKMKASENKLIREAAYGTLWNLRDLLQNSKFERFRDIGMYYISIRDR